MSDPIGDSLDRARVLVDGVDENLGTYKAVNALYQVLELMYLEGTGTLAPAGAKMLSFEEMMARMQQRPQREGPDTKDEAEAKVDARLEDIRKNNYL